jgi:hypothetical protein
MKLCNVLGLLGILFVWPLAAQAENEKICFRNVENSLQILRNSTSDADARLEHGKCLVRFHLQRADVAQAALRVLKDPQEDLFLREDIVQAFGEANLRRSEKVEESLAPEVNEQEKELLGRTVSSAQDILALTQAVKSMNEVVPTTRFEGEFFKTIQGIALDDTNHVLFRSTAVQALESAAKKIVDSGLYEDRLIRLSYETLRTVAARDDIANMSLEASPALERLASAGLPYFKNEARNLPPGRVLSSETKPK